MRGVSKNHPLGPFPEAYAKLLACLAQSDWICQGTVVCRPLRRRVGGKWVKKGPYYLWTGKSQGKTICHALSKAQYQAAQKAIAANRRTMAILAELQAQTLQRILKNLPGVQKRK
jgi:hypothetical protein